MAKAVTTAAEFEAFYASMSGVTVEQLHEQGQRAERCACRDPKCKGWAMVDQRMTNTHERTA